MTRLNVDDARCKALFASGLQRSDAPTADMVAEVIRLTVRRFGIRGCTSQMAQDFGDHPEAALDQALHRDRPPCRTGDGRPGHLRHHRRPGQGPHRHPGTAPGPARSAATAEPGMIPLTIPEIKRLLAALTTRPLPRWLVIHWDAWTGADPGPRCQVGRVGEELPDIGPDLGDDRGGAQRADARDGGQQVPLGASAAPGCAHRSRCPAGRRRTLR